MPLGEGTKQVPARPLGGSTGNLHRMASPRGPQMFDIVGFSYSLAGAGAPYTKTVI